MVTVFHHTPVNAVLFFKQFDRLNFDGLAGKCQKRQIFCYMVSGVIHIIYGSVIYLLHYTLRMDEHTMNIIDLLHHQLPPHTGKGKL